MPKDDVYDDEPTAEELKLLDDHVRSEELPEADDSSETPTPTPAPAPTPKGDEDEDDGDEGAEEGAQEKPPVAEPDVAARDRLATFMAKHKDKTPEQLVELAFQQNQRAAKAEFDARTVGDNLKGVLDRITAAREARQAKITTEREAFRAKVEADPDAALLEAHEARLTSEAEAEEARLADEEFNARARYAVEVASSVIPDFAKQAPAIRDFGIEMGYSQEEVAGMVDPRHITTLYLARMAGNMIRAGILDTSGKFVGLPKPTEELGAEEQPGKRRGSGFGKQPARGAQGAKTLEQQLADVASMSDEDFDKLDPVALEKLLKEVEQA